MNRFLESLQFLFFALSFCLFWANFVLALNIDETSQKKKSLNQKKRSKLYEQITHIRHQSSQKVKDKGLPEKKLNLPQKV